MTGLRGIIFDLDDTLFDCTGQLTEPARERASAILAQNLPNIHADSLTILQRDLSADTGSTDAIRQIGKRYKISDAVVSAALESYNRDDVPHILPYADTYETLDKIVAMGTHISLVTTGRATRQLAKIEKLGLTLYFEPSRNVFIHDPASGNPEKDVQMREAVKASQLTCAETACVGDKLDADISAGNRLGLTTIRIRKGRQCSAEPSSTNEIPDYDIRELAELPAILQS